MKFIQIIALLFISFGASLGLNNIMYAMDTNNSKQPSKRTNVEAFADDSHTDDTFAAKRAPLHDELFTFFISIKHRSQQERRNKETLFNFLFLEIIDKIKNMPHAPIIINNSYTLVRLPNSFFASNLDKKILSKTMETIINWGIKNIPDDAERIFLQQDLAEFLTTFIPELAKKHKTTSESILQKIARFAHKCESSFLYEVAILLQEELGLKTKINLSQFATREIHKNPLLNIKGFFIKSTSDFTRSITSTSMLKLNYDILAFSASDFENLTNEQVKVFTKTLSQSHPNTIHIHNSLQNISESNLLKLFSTIAKNNSITRVALSDQPTPRMETIEYGFDQVFQNRASCNLGLLTNSQLFDLFLQLSWSLSLKELSLNNNNLHLIQASQLKVVFSALCQLPSLQSLDLADIHLGHMNSDQLSSIFENISRYKALKSISLHTNNLSNLSPESLAIISKNLLACESLEEMMLQNNEIGDLSLEQLKAFFEPFRNNQKIKKIFLDNNDMNNLIDEDDNISTVFAPIASMKILEELYLTENNLSDLPKEALTLITEIIESNESLNYIALEANNFSEEQQDLLESKNIPSNLAF